MQLKPACALQDLRSPGNSLEALSRERIGLVPLGMSVNALAKHLGIGPGRKLIGRQVKTRREAA